MKRERKHLSASLFSKEYKLEVNLEVEEEEVSLYVKSK